MFGKDFWPKQFKESLRLRTVAEKFMLDTITRYGFSDQADLAAQAWGAMDKRAARQLRILDGMAGEW